MINNLLISIKNYSIVSIVSALLSFVFVISIGRLYSVEVYGEYSLLITTAGLIITFLYGWIKNSFIRFYLDNTDNGKFYFNILFYISLMNVLLIIAVLLNIMIKFVSFNINIYLIIILYVNLDVFNQIYLQIERLNEKTRSYAKAVLITSIIKIILIIVFYKINTSMYSILYSIIFSLLLINIYLEFRNRIFRQAKIEKPDKKMMIEFVKFGTPLIGISLTSWIIAVSDRYIIKIIFSMREVGLYSYNYDLSTKIVSLLLAGMSLASYPIILKTWNIEREKCVYLINSLIEKYFVFFTPLVLFLASMSKNIITILAPEYEEAYIVFSIATIAIFISGLNLYINKYWELEKKMLNYLIISIVVCLLNILMNIIILPRSSYIFAAITTLISYFIQFLLSFIIIKRKYSISIFTKNIVIVIVISVVSSFLLVLINNLLTYSNLHAETKVVVFIIEIPLYFLLNSVLLRLVRKQKLDLIYNIFNI